MAVFVSHDKADSNGHRAEIHVTTFDRVKVKDLDESHDKSARGVFKPEWLKYDIGGWLGKDEDAFARLKEAFEKGEEVNIRIEVQRKNGLDRTIPIAELRSGPDVAKRVTSKIVSVDGIPTSEALTHPSEDPITGAQPAEPKSAATSSAAPAANGAAILTLLKNLATSRDVDESVLNALQAQALIAGVSVFDIREALTVDGDMKTQVDNAAFVAKESPSFRERNQDGRINLGNYAVTAAVGSEQFAAAHLRGRGLNQHQDTVEFFATLILAITDHIQVGAYGSQRPDRTASSHTRIRGIVYDTIEDNPFPIDLSNLQPGSRSEVDAWVQAVGKTARRRFMFAAQNAYAFPTIASLLDTLGGGAVRTADPATAPVSPTQPEQTYVPDEFELEPEEPDYETEVADAEIAPSAPQSAPEASVAPEPQVAAAPASPPSQGGTALPDSEDLEVFPADILPPGAINASNKPSEETIDQFKQYMQEEVGLDTDGLKKVTTLLTRTFGRAYSKITNIPEETLLDFLDFYIAAGPENFRNVLASL